MLFTWIPGHCSIPGNESADQAAKEAVHSAPTQIPFVPASDLKSFLRREILTQWNDDWRNSTTSYVSLSLRYELGRHLHTHHVGRKSSLPVFELVIVCSVMCIYYAVVQPLSVIPVGNHFQFSIYYYSVGALTVFVVHCSPWYHPGSLGR